MVQSVHAVLRNALECAVREETIPRNVASLVKVTAPQYAVNRGLTALQAQAVLKAARAQRLGALYVLALFSVFAAASCLVFAGKTSISNPGSSKSYRPSSAWGGHCGSCRRRPGARAGPFRCHRRV
jgi:hypothetical protein